MPKQLKSGDRVRWKSHGGTAEGKVVVANESENSDLLWALRGGGGSFGVVTSFEFDLHPIGPDVWMGLVMYPAAEAPKQ